MFVIGFEQVWSVALVSLGEIVINMRSQGSSISILRLICVLICVYVRLCLILCSCTSIIVIAWRQSCSGDTIRVVCRTNS